MQAVCPLSRAVSRGRERGLLAGLCPRGRQPDRTGIGCLCPRGPRRCVPGDRGASGEIIASGPSLGADCDDCRCNHYV